MAAWVLPASGSSIVDKHDWSGRNTPKGYVLRYGNGRPSFTFGSRGWNGVGTKSRVPANTWSHLVACYDGKELRLFCNGEISAKRPMTRPLRPSARPLRIGHGTFDKAPKRRYYGLVDEVMIWSRPLSNAKVNQLYRLQGGK